MIDVMLCRQPATTRFIPDPELANLYRRLWRKHFGGKVPDCEVGWHRFPRASGMFDCVKGNGHIPVIRINPTVPKDEIEEIMLHEMSHLMEALLNRRPSHSRNFNIILNSTRMGSVVDVIMTS